MEANVYKRCKRCNRLLRSRLAKERGYGPHCWILHKKEEQKNTKTLFDLINDSKIEEK